VLPNGRIVYWNGLQNIANCGQISVAADAGKCLGNAKSEILDLTGSTPLFMPVAVPAGNHDDLFCSDQRLLSNGTLLDTGGTYWATEEPAGGTGIDGADGLAELYGSKSTRVFNPATNNWNNMLLFDPSKMGTAADQGWHNAGMFPLGATSGGAELLMPLDASKPHGLDTVHILVAGGALGVSPDSYMATDMSQMITLTKSASGWNTSSPMTGNLNNRRWCSSSLPLPNGQAVVFNGADKDEVILPGSEMPVHQAELFDPATNKWTALSSSSRDRTYHNSAILLPDGSILVGGHAPINQGYGGTGNALPLDQLGFAHNLKDPSF